MSLFLNASDFWNWLWKVLTTPQSYGGSYKLLKLCKNKQNFIRFDSHEKFRNFPTLKMTNIPNTFPSILSMQWFPGIVKFYPPQWNISVYKIKSCLVAWVQMMLKEASFHFNEFNIKCKIWVCQPTWILASCFFELSWAAYTRWINMYIIDYRYIFAQTMRPNNYFKRCTNILHNSSSSNSKKTTVYMYSHK